MPVSVFSLVLIFTEKDIKRSPIELKFTVIFYGPKEAPEAKELGQKSHEASTRVEGAPYPQARPLIMWAPRGLP